MSNENDHTFDYHNNLQINVSPCSKFSNFLRTNSTNTITIIVLTINISVYINFSQSLTYANQILSDSLFHLGSIKSFIEQKSDVISKFTELSSELLNTLDYMVTTLNIKILSLPKPQTLNLIIPTAIYNISLVGNQAPQTILMNVSESGYAIIYAVCSDVCPNNYNLQFCDLLNQCLNLNTITVSTTIHKFKLDYLTKGVWYVSFSCTYCLSMINLTIE